MFQNKCCCPVISKNVSCQTLDTLHTSFPRALVPYLPDLLNASLRHLQALYPTFVQYYIASSESPPSTSEEEAVELAQLLCPIIDFLAAIIRGGKCKEWFSTENMGALVESVFKYTQMTDDDVSTVAGLSMLFSPFDTRLRPGNKMPTRLFRKKMTKHKHTALELLGLISSV